MDSNRDRLLKDLSATLLERTRKAAEDMAGMCKMVNIPRHEFDLAASSIYLYLFMGLLYDSKPSLTPEELGFLVRGQYEFFRKGMKDERKA